MKGLSISNLNQEVVKMMNIPGNVRGEVLRANLDYIRLKEGEKMILMEDRLRELGFPLKLQGFKSLKWYPEFFSVLIMLVAKEVFNWQDSDVFDMGKSAPRSSFLVQVLMKHFSSLKKTFGEYPKYWRAHFDFGELELIEFNEAGKHFSFRIKGYRFHPIACVYYAGYFLQIAKFNIKSEEVRIQEIKCAEKDEVNFHEYRIDWK